MKSLKTFLEKRDAYSMGILLYSGNKVFLVHPTNPDSYKSINAVKGKIDSDFFRLTYHQWSIPKGHVEGNEEPFETAKREFEEETGTRLNAKTFDKDLGTVQYKSGKIIRAFLVKGSGSEKFIKSNLIVGLFLQGLPENDAGGWFDKGLAKELMQKDQVKFLDRF